MSAVAEDVALDGAKDASGPGLWTRIGLAVAKPPWALALASDRGQAGRSGSDLIAVIALALVATQLRWLVSAGWLATAVEPALGLRAMVRVLADVVSLKLGLLVLSAFAIFVLAGSRRNLGRAFDLACVAALPLWLVELVATVIVRVAGLDVPPLVGWMLSGVSFAWTGMLVALALRPARISPRQLPPVPEDAQRRARYVALGLGVAFVVGLATQVAWISRNLELVRPMTRGDAAPAFALPSVDAAGKLAAPVALSSTRGQVTVLDFWATWCGPCLRSMPKLEQLARSRSDVAVLAINTDDPAAARALFAKSNYTMTLLFDEGEVSTRYGASTIPYTVILDRDGVIRHVVRGTGEDLAALIDELGPAK